MTDILLRSGKFRISAILRKTTAKSFRDWKPGDIIRFQMTLKHTGGASAGNYATYVIALNLTQETAVMKSQSEMVNVLRAFDLEEINDEETQLNEVISIAMWAIRRLPRAHRPENVLRDLKRAVGDDHEYSAAIDEMIADVSVNDGVASSRWVSEEISKGA